MSGQSGKNGGAIYDETRKRFPRPTLERNPGARRSNQGREGKRREGVEDKPQGKK